MSSLFNLIKSRSRTEQIVIAMFLALSVVGAAMRFVNIDKKEFWHDESYTALVISGHTTRELAETISQRLVPFSELRAYCTVGSASSLNNVMHSLLEDEPGHAPIFYLKELVLCKLFGTTPLTMRLYSVLIGVATLPVILWLAFETYESILPACLTLAFASLSPALIYYSQEARDYAFGMFWMFLTSACLLHALRKPSRRAWIVYAISIVIGLYSWLFMTLVMVAQVLYVMLILPRGKKSWRPFLISLAVAAGAFAPWLLLLSSHEQNFSRAYDWIQPGVPFAALAQAWLAIPYKAFALFGFETRSYAGLLLCITVLQGAAVALVLRSGRNAKWLQIFMIAVWFLVFAGQDVVLGGGRSAVFRYHTIVIGSIVILFPYLIFYLWRPGLSKSASAVAVALIVLVLGTELTSDYVLLQSKIWPDKGIRRRYTLPMADELNEVKDVVLVCEEHRINLLELLDLSWVIDPNTKLLFRTELKPQPLPLERQTLYLWNPSSDLQTELSLSNYSITDDPSGLDYLKVAKRRL